MHYFIYPFPRCSENSEMFSCCGKSIFTKKEGNISCTFLKVLAGLLILPKRRMSHLIQIDIADGFACHTINSIQWSCSCFTWVWDDHVHTRRNLVYLYQVK